MFIGLRKLPPLYILEPGNPYNNILEGFTPEDVVQFQLFARTTITRIENIRSKNCIPESIQQEVLKKFPSIFRVSNEISAELRKGKYSCGIGINHKSQIPVIRITNHEEFYQVPIIQNLLHQLLSYLETIVITAPITGRIQAVKHFMNIEVGSEEVLMDYRKISESYDVSFIIPSVNIPFGTEELWVVLGLTLSPTETCIPVG